MEFSYGPKITQAVPRAEKTLVVPTEHGLPVMAKDSAFHAIDPRTMDVPAMDAMEDSVPPKEVRARIQGPNPHGTFAAGAKHDKDVAVRTGFATPEEAGKWAGTMKRKIARQSIHGPHKEAFQRHVANEEPLNIPPDEHAEDAYSNRESTNKWSDKRFEQAAGNLEKVRSSMSPSDSDDRKRGSALLGLIHHSEASKFARTPEQRKRLKALAPPEE